MTEAARVWTDSVQRHWPNAPERIEDFKHRFPDRWVRFHSLPDSRRYPETEDEYAIVFGRHHTVLDELAAERPGAQRSAQPPPSVAVGPSQWALTPRAATSPSRGQHGRLAEPSAPTLVTCTDALS